MSRKRKWLFRLAAFGLGIILCEIMLSAAAAVSPWARYYLSPPWKRELLLPDEKLGFRMTPIYPGNDAWGFRNRKITDCCDVLAIGDSMTYGFAAPVDKCWPRQLEGLTGKTVYNMSCGGYSPCEYYLLLDKGLTLNPKVVIVGIYLGNDMSEAHRVVHVDKRATEFASARQETQATSLEAGQVATGAEESGPFKQRTKQPEADIHPVRKWLSDHSSLYGLMRGLYATITNKEYKNMGEDADEDSFEDIARLPGRVAFDADLRFRTVFHDPEFYVQGMDLDDPRIQEGKRITEAVLQAMQAKLRERDIQLIVALIPTKETVYGQLIKDQRGKIPDSYFELVRKEGRLTAELEAFLQSRDIEFVNTTSALRSCFGKGVRPYPPSDNTHPNAKGYQAIAEALAPLLTGSP